MKRKRFLSLVLAGAVGLLLLSQCGNMEPLAPALDGPSSTGLAKGPSGNANVAAIEAAKGVQNRHTQALMQRPGVVGTAVGLGLDGRPDIIVYLSEEGAGKGIPADIEAVPVRVEVSGVFRALKPGAPKITQQPSSQTVEAGQTATFTVVASNTTAYQWRVNGAAIPGATSDSYTTPPTTAEDDGLVFDVVVSNDFGLSKLSSQAILTVTGTVPPPAPSAPVITSEPADQAVTEGETATFTVSADGYPAPSYQWRRDGSDIAGATATSYTTPATTVADDGALISVLVYNTEGSAVSREAVLTVAAAPPPPPPPPPSDWDETNHRGKQPYPVKLGTSGGWAHDLANGYCCGGTLGSLVQDATGRKFILSNYHVFQSDILMGGNSLVAQIGDPIIQPGLIDVGCLMANANVVATLASAPSLPGSNVDAALAEVTPGAVAPNGAILEIGVLGTGTAAAYINQRVMKSGRTTGLTRSTIAGLNGTVSVAYDNECAGGAAFTKTFSGQVIVANKANRFLNGGDSGSLLVTDSSTPTAVGLLFAGSTRYSIANPIDEVLNHFSSELGSTVSMVGN